MKVLNNMMNRYQTLLALVLALCLNAAYACSEGEKDCTGDKAGWATYMKDNMPLALCATDSPFVKCSDFSQARCKEFASKATDECLAENDKDIPRLLNRREAGQWGDTIGNCSGGKIFSRIEIKADKDASCSEYLKPVASSNTELRRDKIKIMISESPKLTQLNSDMNRLYLNIKSETAGVNGETGAGVSAIDDEQRAWAASVINQCDAVPCLEKAYTERINQMKKDWKDAL